MEEWRLRGKDADPQKTVEHIRGLLENAGIKTVYTEGEISINGCCYSRLNLDMPYGSLFGSNGKGMSRELCMASAYGELMERLQNLMFAAMVRRDDPEAAKIYPEDAPLYDPKGDEQPECVERIIKSVAASINAPTFLSSAEEMTASMLADLAADVHKGRYPMELYYSVRKKKAEYLPTGLIQQFIYSNGMAAGNTLGEALVEGISEIFERYSQMRFYQGGLVPPRIPDEEIDRWPRIRNLIKEVEKDGRYGVDIRDCSLGKGLPVVCTIFTDRETGGVGIKFGAQPDMGVAMERTFTEAVQGKTIFQASNGNELTFITEGHGHRSEKWNTIKTGMGRIPAHIVSDSPDYPFKRWKDADGRSNDELSAEMTELAGTLGADVYIRDNSFLGFPAVCIYMAGFSEAKPVDALTLKELLLMDSVQRMFADLSSLDDGQVKKMLMLAGLKSGSVLENTIPAISGYRSVCPVKGLAMEAWLLRLACCYRLGDNDAALACLEQLISFEKQMKSGPDVIKYLIGLRFFIEGKKTGTPMETVRAVMEKNCAKDITDRICFEFEDRAQVLCRLFASEEIREEADRQYRTITGTYKKLAKIKNSRPESAADIEERFKKLGL